MDFELHRKDLYDSRFVRAAPPSPQDGEALLRAELVGLTSAGNRKFVEGLNVG